MKFTIPQTKAVYSNMFNIKAVPTNENNKINFQKAG